jgi:oxygen-independent coproporphyrinogen III oxidase
MAKAASLEKKQGPLWNKSRGGMHFSPAMIFEIGRKAHHTANTAYPIGHGHTYGSYRLGPEEYENFVAQNFAAVDRLGLYVHIPFCEQRCRYCEYTVLDRYDASLEALYESLLMKEFELSLKTLKGETKTVVGLDIGGGTPLLVRTGIIEKIVTFVRSHFNLAPTFGISIETTPKIAAHSPEKLERTRALGIERISMGVQSASPALLAEHNRDYNTLDMNLRAATNIRRAGFNTFNIDIMYGFARQSLRDWENTVNYVVDLEPDCITTYRVRYKGTSVSDDAREVSLEDVNEKYLAAQELLKRAGYGAFPGRNTYSRVPGNPGLSPYLAERVIHGTPYIGYGPGAQSFSPALLSYNLGAATKSMDQYERALGEGKMPIQDMYFLPKEEAMAKMISVSFYYGAVHLPSFEALFGTALEEEFPEEVRFLQERGFMETREKSLALTGAGALNINGIIALFYSDAIKEYLVNRNREGAR